MAAVKPGDSFVYFYTVLSKPLLNPDLSNPIVLVRVQLAQLNDIANQLYCYSTSQVWKSVPVDGSTTWETDAKEMFEGAPELSVRWHDAQKEWIAVFTPFDSGEIMMLTAPSPQGPTGIPQEALTWSSQQPIYQIPEMTKSDPNYPNK
jgi:hypothetical protein